MRGGAEYEAYLICSVLNATLLFHCDETRLAPLHTSHIAPVLFVLDSAAWYTKALFCILCVFSCVYHYKNWHKISRGTMLSIPHKNVHLFKKSMRVLTTSLRHPTRWRSNIHDAWTIWVETVLRDLESSADAIPLFGSAVSRCGVLKLCTNGCGNYVSFWYHEECLCCVLQKKLVLRERLVTILCMHRYGNRDTVGWARMPKDLVAHFCREYM